jgi:hypothetical protein
VRGFRLTVRHGARVEKETYDEPAAALAAMEAWVERLQPQARRRETQLLTRRIQPEAQVSARITLTAPGRGLLRPEAGLDIRGDGSLDPFHGAVRRQPLVKRRGETLYQAIGRAIGA